MKPGLSLPASVEERLSGWMRIQEGRAQTSRREPPGPTITLSRAFGCEGFPLAARLQELLSLARGEDWSIFDKALIEKVSQDEGISARILDDMADPARGLEAFGFHPMGAVTHDQAFAKLAETILVLARQGRAIIMGRGAAVLCAALPNAYHFRLEAGLEWRIGSVMRRTGASREEAERLVRTQSRARDQFIKDYLGADVADPAHYDAVFNNERHSVEHVAAAILAYVGVPAR